MIMWTGVMPPANGKLDIACRNSGVMPASSAMRSFASLLERTGAARAEGSAVYSELSSNAKDLLYKIKNHIAITKAEWTGLTNELLEKNFISREEYDLTRADVRLIPLPAWAKTGGSHFSHGGQGSAVRDSLMKLMRGEDPYDWRGDPSQYLEGWLERLRKMRSEWDEENNRLLYETETIDEYAKAVNSVKELLADLLARA